MHRPATAAHRPATAAGRLVSIHIGSARAPLKSVREVRAVAGRGLEGDRYFAGAGTWSSPALWSEVTLVESEVVAAIRSAISFDGTAADLRRNLVTEGVHLPDFIGARFLVGDVELEGTRSCDPCRHLEREVGRAGLKGALAGRGGLRARIVREGTVRVGDPIVRLDATPPTSSSSPGS